MDQKRLQHVKQQNQHTFYKYPYLNILIATVPVNAINDLWIIWTTFIRDQETAALVLQNLLDRGRKVGLQIFIEIQSIDTLPEEHRLTSAVLSLTKEQGIFSTPSTVTTSSFSNLKRLFKD